MLVDNYIEQKKEMQSCLLKMIDDEENVGENYQHLISLINLQEIENSPYEIKSFLYLISSLIDNHYRSINFFKKMEKIMIALKKIINTNLSNDEIFKIFKGNKRFLLFLIKCKIIYCDQRIIYILGKTKYQEANYPEYLANQIRNVDKVEINDEINDQKKVEIKQNIGQNDNYVCHLIRNDLDDEFKQFITEKKISLNSNIEQSVYETNPFLINKKLTIIEYACFFGSYKIFKYLFQNNAKIEPTIWIYIMHGKNHQIVNFLENQHLVPDEKIYGECLLESIKCHHNDIAYYIEHKINDISLIEKNIINCAIEHYNYAYFPKDINQNIIPIFIKCNYYPIIELLLKESKIDIKESLRHALKNNKYEIANLLNQHENGFENIIKYIKSANKANKSSKIHININLESNIIQVESVSFKFNPIKESCILGLNEAFSTSPEDLEFIKASIPFNEIVDSDITYDYQTI